VSFRIFGILLLIFGSTLLVLFDVPLAIALGGAAFILGFLVVALDTMRRSIEKTE
jgi:hypothetical protein